MIQNFFLSTYYDKGYSQALLDVKNWFERHSITLGWLRMYNRKYVEMVLNAISKNPEAFQKEGDDTELRFEYTKDKKKISRIYIEGASK
jgi:hypothetical protein